MCWVWPAISGSIAPWAGRCSKPAVHTNAPVRPPVGTVTSAIARARVGPVNGRAARVFKDFTYRTRKSWSRQRRVVGKAEYLPNKANPRFVVTNLPVSRAGAKRLYEKLYCIRGEMENRIKEQQLGLFADRTSTATIRANQLRLYFSSFAYVLMHGLRRLGLAGTQYARAQCTTIRLKLLKIGARIRVTVRKVWLSFSEAYPYASDLAQILANIRRHPAWAPPG